MPYIIVERAGVIVERKKLEKDRTSIGRGADSDVVLDDPQIGAKLAALYKEGADYILEDMGSMAGVMFQNERVNKLRLTDGMRFEAFPYSFIFEDEEGGAGRPSDGIDATQAMDMSTPGESAELVCVNENYGPFQ